MDTLQASVRIPLKALHPAHNGPAADGQVLLELMDTINGTALDQLIDLLSGQLRQRGATLSSERVSQHMRFIAQLQERREADELAANPARRAGIKRAAKTFAHKLQSSLSPLPLPDPGDRTR